MCTFYKMNMIYIKKRRVAVVKEDFGQRRSGFEETRRVLQPKEGMVLLPALLWPLGMDPSGACDGDRSGGVGGAGG
jgi:hypothetical protein